MTAAKLVPPAAPCVHGFIALL